MAPVIVDPENDEVYFTPLYYTMAHFSKYIRPGAKVIGLDKSDADLQVTAAQNLDGSIAVVVFNEGETLKSFELSLGETSKLITIQPQALQTVLLSN